jgi:hypothetical protein
MMQKKSYDKRLTHKTGIIFTLRREIFDTNEKTNMKTTQNLLINFIKDFDLEIDGEDAVCFDAMIEFRAKGIYRRLDSEVHIITLSLTGLSVLYLLHPDIPRLHIPDTLPFDPEQFTYLKNSALMMASHNALFGRYLITITPLRNGCSEQTVAELKAKRFN